MSQDPDIDQESITEDDPDGLDEFYNTQKPEYFQKGLQNLLDKEHKGYKDMGFNSLGTTDQPPKNIIQYGEFNQNNFTNGEPDFHYQENSPNQEHDSKPMDLFQFIQQIDQEHDSEDEGIQDYQSGGYHPVHIGEVIQGRYVIIQKIGWGHFSTVWLTKDFKYNTYVALKIQKSAPHYLQAAYDEVQILQKVARKLQTPEWIKQAKEYHKNKKELGRDDCHIVQLLNSFIYKGPYGNHFCFVFEILGVNLLQVIKRYNYQGVPMHLCRQIAKQVLIGLDYLHTICGVIHTDLKPENVLLCLTQQEIKDIVQNGELTKNTLFADRITYIRQYYGLEKQEEKIIQDQQNKKLKEAQAKEQNSNNEKQTQNNKAGANAAPKSEGTSSNNTSQNIQQDQKQKNKKNQKQEQNQQTQQKKNQQQSDDNSENQSSLLGQDQNDISINTAETAESKQLTKNQQKNLKQKRQKLRKRKDDNNDKQKDPKDAGNQTQTETNPNQKEEQKQNATGAPAAASGSEQKQERVEELFSLNAGKILDKNKMMRGPELDENFRLKIADLGNACWLWHHFATEIQTRQYRSPQVILQSSYNDTADIWSLACMLFEMLTGDFLFEPRRGPTFSKNDDHLAQISELTRQFPKDFAFRGEQSKRFFDEKGNMRKIPNLQFWSLENVLTDKYQIKQQEAHEFAQFLMPMLNCYPEKRATAAGCLKHQWLEMPKQANFKMNDEEYREWITKKQEQQELEGEPEPIQFLDVDDMDADKQDNSRSQDDDDQDEIYAQTNLRYIERQFIDRSFTDLGYIGYGDGIEIDKLDFTGNWQFLEFQTTHQKQ